MGLDRMFAPGVHQDQGRFRRVQVGPQFCRHDVGNSTLSAGPVLCIAW